MDGSLPHFHPGQKALKASEMNAAISEEGLLGALKNIRGGNDIKVEWMGGGVVISLDKSNGKREDVRPIDRARVTGYSEGDQNYVGFLADEYNVNVGEEITLYCWKTPSDKLDQAIWKFVPRLLPNTGQVFPVTKYLWPIDTETLEEIWFLDGWFMWTCIGEGVVGDYPPGKPPPRSKSGEENLARQKEVEELLKSRKLCEDCG
jgi:hypothetical protein